MERARSNTTSIQDDTNPGNEAVEKHKKFHLLPHIHVHNPFKNKIKRRVSEGDANDYNDNDVKNENDTTPEVDLQLIYREDVTTTTTMTTDEASDDESSSMKTHSVHDNSISSLDPKILEESPRPRKFSIFAKRKSTIYTTTTTITRTNSDDTSTSETPKSSELKRDDSESPIPSQSPETPTNANPNPNILPLRETKSKQSFISAIFGERKRSKSIESSKEESKKKTDVSNPPIHPALQRSYNDETMNCILTCIIVFGVIFPFIFFVLNISFHFVLWLTCFYVCPSRQNGFLSVTPIQASITILSVLFVLWQTSHRVLGYIAGLGLRLFLRWLFKVPLTQTGVFDIHFSWISWRGFLDKNEVVIRHGIFRNPPSFNKTPFLLYVKEITVSFDLFEFIKLCAYGKEIVFDMVLLDNVEIFFERTDPKPVPVKPISCPFSGSKQKSATNINDHEEESIKPAKDSISGNNDSSMSSTKSRSRSLSVTKSESEANEAENLNTLNFWAGIGCSNREEESKMLSAMVHGIWKDIETKIAHKLHKPWEKHPPASNDDDDYSDVESAASNGAPIGRKRSFSVNSSTNSNKSAAPPMPSMVTNRVVVFDILAHPLDILCTRHREPHKSADITIDIFHLNRNEITGKPYRAGDDRRILTAKRWGQKFGDKFGAVLFEKNSMEIANIIAETTANKTMSVISSIAHNIQGHVMNPSPCASACKS